MDSFTENGVSYEWEFEPDRDSFKRIMVESFYHCYKDLTKDVLKVNSDLKEWLSQHFSDEFIDGLKNPESPFRLLAAKVDRIPAGYAIFDVSRYPDLVYISELSVDPAFQRRGIGKQLVFSILKPLPQTVRLVLITRKANFQACAFYPSIGFKYSDYIHEGYDPELYIGFEYKNKKG